MIRRVFSSLASFKTLTFSPGLNILLVDTTPEASERQTRNRAGKSSLTEIFHFLLGGNLEQESIFRDEILRTESFGMEFDLGGHPVCMERCAANPSVLEVVSGAFDHWPIQPSMDAKSGKTLIRNSLWKDILGRCFFNLPETVDRFGPTFRSLISYFIRRQSVKGYLDHVRQSEDQQLFDQQVAISYLLGLDWRIPQQWQLIRDREKALKVLKKAAQEGTLGDAIPSTSDLRTKLTVAESHANELRENLKVFRVLPEYRQLEGEASALTRTIAQYLDENTIDYQLRDDLEDSIKQEAPATSVKLDEVYRQAGIVLPGLALKRLDDVRAFHESVLANRRLYLEGEIAAVAKRIDGRDRSIQALENRRSEVMNLLQSHGALEHFTGLQSEFTRVQQEVEHLRQMFSTAEALETGKTELALERQQLLLRLRQDHREEGETLSEAILAFEEISKGLYEDAGSLHISESENGPVFEIKIHGNRSQGIKNMQIFCFDMMIMQLCSMQGLGPGFLVHDSHLFDGVDSRQTATALAIGSRMADQLGFQYIVTMNSDALPQRFPEQFRLAEHIVPTRLTDATESGGLFGIRFG